MELLFFILLVLASVLDASGRRKKRQRRMEEMEAEESREDGAVGTLERPSGSSRQPPRRAEPPVADRTATDPTASTPRRDTADSMIPEDLWSILTGQTPPERSPEPKPEPAETPTYEAWGGEDVDDLHRPEREPAASPLESAPAPVTSGPIAARSLTGTSSAEGSSGLQRPRSSAAARYASLLREGGRDSLRTAVVLREILDSPPGLRAPGEIGAAGGRRPDS